MSDPVGERSSEREGCRLLSLLIFSASRVHLPVRLWRGDLRMRLFLSSTRKISCTPLSILIARSLRRSRKLVLDGSWLSACSGAFRPSFIRERCVMGAAIVLIAGLLFALLIIWMLYKAVRLVFYSKSGGYETDLRLWNQ